MQINLTTMHLGDVLMAMPAIREGDVVCVGPKHRVPGLKVEWLDYPGGIPGGTYPAPRNGRHNTDCWLESTGREPVRHQLLPPVDRDLLILAPAVFGPDRQWTGWDALHARLAGREGLQFMPEHADRGYWMHLLNRAYAVVCPDNGTAHMADALGCPMVVAMHGVPSNWPHCAPYWNRDHCIARETMGDISVDDVIEVLNA